MPNLPNVKEDAERPGRPREPVIKPRRPVDPWETMTPEEKAQHLLDYYGRYVGATMEYATGLNGVRAPLGGNRFARGREMYDGNQYLYPHQPGTLGQRLGDRSMGAAPPSGSIPLAAPPSPNEQLKELKTPEALLLELARRAAILR